MKKDESSKIPSELPSEAAVNPMKVELSRNKNVTKARMKLPADYGRGDRRPGAIGPFRPIKKKGKPTTIKGPSHDDDKDQSRPD